MVKGQIDPETGDLLPDFGIENDEDKFYKKYKTENTETDAVYIIKANMPINTEAHSYVQTQLSSGKVKFLIDESQAKVKLLGTKIGQTMDADKKANYFKPFVATTALRDQMLNLVEDNEGVNIILKMANRGVGKDKFSAFEYALYYIKQKEDSRKKKCGRKISDFMFFSQDKFL